MPDAVCVISIGWLFPSAAVKVPRIRRVRIRPIASFPPIAAMYRSSTASTDGASGGAAGAAPCAAADSEPSGGIDAGSWEPWWQVAHVTARRPWKLALLISRIMRIISLAFPFAGLSSRSTGQGPVSLVTWQKEHLTPRESFMKFMIGMTSLEGTPWRTWMFL